VIASSAVLLDFPFTENEPPIAGANNLFAEFLI
jgi:hypothetical protein